MLDAQRLRVKISWKLDGRIFDVTFKRSCFTAPLLISPPSLVRTQFSEFLSLSETAVLERKLSIDLRGYAWRITQNLWQNRGILV